MHCSLSQRDMSASIYYYCLGALCIPIRVERQANQAPGPAGMDWGHSVSTLENRAVTLLDTGAIHRVDSVCERGGAVDA